MVYNGRTTFFRSVGSFPPLELLFTEDLLHAKERPFRIAVAGCSTGEDAYTYAALCETHDFKDYQVDGYDLAEWRLKEARRAWYDLRDEEAIALFADRRIKKGLLQDDGMGRTNSETRIKINPILQRRVEFHCLDFSLQRLSQLYDLIVCTYVLYQDQVGGKKQALQNLLESLKPNGVLFQTYFADVAGTLASLGMEASERERILGSVDQEVTRRLHEPIVYYGK